MKKDNKQFNNKGFTLVELLIAGAIAGIAILSITAFMVVGARAFSSTSAEVNLQQESQLVFNQMQDLIIDTTLGLAYAYVPNGDSITSHGIEVIDDSSVPSDVQYKKLYIYNENMMYVIVWDRVDSKILYEEHNISTDADGNTVTSPSITNALMGEYCTGFSVDLNRVKDKNIVSLFLRFEKGSKSYESHYNITMRNKVTVNEPLEIVNPTPVTPAGHVEIHDIWAEPNSRYQFATTVTSTDGGVPSQEVRWFCENQDGNTTGIDVNTGLLVISPEEKRDEFEVKVVTRDGLASDTCRVHINRVKDITLKMINYNGEEVSQSEEQIIKNNIKTGDRLTLEAIVNHGAEFEPLTEGVITNTTSKYTDIDWTYTTRSDCMDFMSKSNETATQTGELCSFIVKSGGIESDVAINIKATSEHSMKYDVPIDKEYEIKTFEQEPDFEIEVPSNNGMFWRGDEYVVLSKDGFEPQTGHIILYDFRLRKVVRNDNGEVTGYEVLKEHWKEAFYQEMGKNCKIYIPIDIDETPYAYDEYFLDIKAYEVKSLVDYNNGTRAKPYPHNDLSIENCRMSNTVSLPINPMQLYVANGENDYNDSTREIEYIVRPFYNKDVYKGKYPSSIQTVIPGEYPLQFKVSNIKEKSEFKLDDCLSWEFINPSTGETINIDKDLIEINNQRQRWYVTFKKSGWRNDLPSRIRAIPTITVKSKDTNKRTSYRLYKSHIDIVVSNIDVAGEKMYFPYPSSEDFQWKDLGLTAGSNVAVGVWKYANKFSGDYQFKITRYQSSNGVINYTLEVYPIGMLNDDNNKLGVYQIRNEDTEWHKLY